MAEKEIWTIKKLLNWTTEYFKKHKLETPRLDAELLLSYVLKKTRIYLYTDFEQIVNKDELKEFKKLIQNRINGFSVATLIGEKDFMGFKFFVNDKVLIPRPDTETWVEKVIQIHKNDIELFVADIGCGSGAIICSFLKYCKNAKGVGIDISDDAIEISRKNIKNLSLENRIELRKGDFFNALKKGEKFDGIFSNPPYIPTDDIKFLQKEVKNEPLIALDGGKDGLNFYRKIAENAEKFLNSGGFLAVEVGIHQSLIVKEMFESTGYFTDFEIIKDYGNIERAVYCIRK